MRQVGKDNKSCWNRISKSREMCLLGGAHDVFQSLECSGALRHRMF